MVGKAHERTHEGATHSSRLRMHVSTLSKHLAASPTRSEPTSASRSVRQATWPSGRTSKAVQGDLQAIFLAHPPVESMTVSTLSDTFNAASRCLGLLCDICSSAATATTRRGKSLGSKAAAAPQHPPSCTSIHNVNTGGELGGTAAT
eukprot:scaffold195885_cov27-Tisochrysis_lutea.AAC.1